MRRIVLMFALLAAVLVPAVAQKIETETSDRTRIVHLKTALNHLTVIEVGEPVVQVAAGSPTFKVEWRENKVFVQPTEADAATNLFIWTASQRLNYELEPADSVTNMDFARPGACSPGAGKADGCDCASRCFAVDHRATAGGKANSATALETASF